MLTCAPPMQLTLQHPGKDKESDTEVDHEAVRAALKAAPGKFRTVQDEDAMQLLLVADPAPAEAPLPVPWLPPTSPFFQCSVQEEVASNTSRLTPAKEKAANEKASMVSFRCTSPCMAPHPCCMRSFSVGTRLYYGLLVLKALSHSLPLPWLPADRLCLAIGTNVKQ